MRYSRIIKEMDNIGIQEIESDGPFNCGIYTTFYLVGNLISERRNKYVDDSLKSNSKYFRSLKDAEKYFFELVKN